MRVRVCLFLVDSEALFFACTGRKGKEQIQLLFPFDGPWRKPGLRAHQATFPFSRLSRMPVSFHVWSIQAAQQPSSQSLPWPSRVPVSALLSISSQVLSAFPSLPCLPLTCGACPPPPPPRDEKLLEDMLMFSPCLYPPFCKCSTHNRWWKVYFQIAKVVLRWCVIWDGCYCCADAKS